MCLYKISNDIFLDKFLEKLGTTKEGSKILCNKSNIGFFYIKDLRTPAANILKQDALSIGADLAVPKNCVTCEDKHTDALLLATKDQLRKLCKKEKIQPFGLNKISEMMQEFLKIKKDKTQIMGILNANEDSFFKNSRFDSINAQEKISNMICEGADIIDIGGVSSRPGSLPVSVDEEFSRVKNIIDIIYNKKLYEKVKFSLDSYSVKSLRYALDHGFSIVNDITALENSEVAKLASSYNATVILMHKLGDTLDMQKNPTYDNVVLDIDSFFKQRIQRAQEFGVKDIVLDVGIGFGKTLEHNLLLLKNLEHFLHFGYPLLVGASRKSMINMITPCVTQERLSGTLTLHLEAFRNGASILRVHDVKEHFQAIKVQEALQGAF
jgi:dihydropteroate synthase